jgi:hypothetical protein
MENSQPNRRPHPGKRVQLSKEQREQLARLNRNDRAKLAKDFLFGKKPELLPVSTVQEIPRTVSKRPKYHTERRVAPSYPTTPNSREEYAAFLKGKRVACVAQATSIVGSGQGPLIDSYDLVVRTNYGLEIPEELVPDIGTRCDILYSHISPHGGKYFQYSISERVLKYRNTLSWVCCPYPSDLPKIEDAEFFLGVETKKFNEIYRDRVTSYLKGIKGAVPFRQSETSVFLPHLLEMNGRHPNTGFAAIWDLLAFDVSEIYMVGYTFFLGGNYPQYISHPLTEKEIIGTSASWGLEGKPKPHVILPQIQYLKKLMDRDSRIKVDEVLADIVRTHG